MTRDWRDQLRYLGLANAADQEAWYHYDSAGQRVRKFVKQNGAVSDRRYLGGYEELREDPNAGDDFVRVSLHVMDGASRVALIETKTSEAGQVLTDVELDPVIRMQLGNHLSSVSAETNLHGELITYEEYHPTAPRPGGRPPPPDDISLKRYRYTGMERDEETGFSVHGVRYYAPWLGRWASCDPIGMQDGVNRYAYVAGRPVGLRDSTGESGQGLTTAQQAAMRARMASVQAQARVLLSETTAGIAEGRIQDAALRAGARRLTAGQAAKFVTRQALRQGLAGSQTLLGAAIEFAPPQRLGSELCMP